MAQCWATCGEGVFNVNELLEGICMHMHVNSKFTSSLRLNIIAFCYILSARNVVASKKPTNSLQVEITHRIAWRKTHTQCTQASIDAATLLDRGSGRLVCRSGCSGNIGDLSYFCTDFSETDNWSAGERTYSYNFTTVTTQLFFEAS